MGVVQIAVELAAGYVSLVPSAKGAEKKIISDLGDVGDKAAKAFEQAFSKRAEPDLTKGAGDAGGKAGKGFTDKFGSVGLGAIGGLSAGFGMALVGGMVTAATTGAQAVSDAFFEVLDRNRDADRLGAQLGFSPDQAGRLGKIAGELFASNFGDSMGDVNKALKGVAVNKLLPGWASDADIEDFSGRLLNITSLFEHEVGATTRTIATLMRTGLARNAGEALDIITRGFQTGGDTAGDLLDTLTEYPTQFRKLGLTGEVAMGLISQGLQAGARDSDIVADSLKEFSIRAVDGSVLTSQSFARLGIDGAKMAKTIAKGGPEAAAGLDQILDKLRGVKDPVAQAQIAVGLFGTQAEDLGAALFALDPSSAVSTLGQVGGAATLAGQQMTDNLATKIDNIKRLLDPASLLATFQTDGFEGIKEQVGLGVQGISDIWNQYGPQVMLALDRAKVAAIQWWTDNGPGIIDEVSKWWNETAKPALGDALGAALKGAAVAAMATVKSFFTNPETWTQLFDFADDIVGWITNPFSKIGELSGKAMVNGIIGAWNDLHLTLPEVDLGPLGKIGGQRIDTPDIPKLHSGGIVPGPRGSEMLALLQAGETVLPTQRRRLVSAAAMPGAGGGFQIRDINVTGQADPHRTAQEILLGQRRAAVLSR